MNVEYAFGTTNGSTMESTVSAFTAINAEDGVYSVPLAAMNNAVNNFGGTVIIRMTDAAGKYSYQLVKVARMTVTVTNKTFPGEPAMPGNSVELSFDGLYRSINKISGIFNPTTFYLRYTMNGTEINGTLGQYQQMDKSGITLTIPGDIAFAEGEDTTTVTAANGYVFGSMYSAANPFSAMYYMTDVGVGTNFNAVTVSFAFQKLSDIPITVMKMPTVAVTLNVVGSDDAAVVVTNEDGTAQAAENGVYTLGFGTYRYSVEADGFIKEVGKFSVGSADGEAKTVTVTLRAADAGTWDGSTRTAVTPNAEGIYEIRTGAELAWFAAQVNAGTGVAYNAKLMKDFSLNWKQWTPIGSSTQKYTGTFDGNGHVITDLYINTADANQGLFGYVTAATVKNLGVTGEVTSTNNYVGGIIGYAAGATVIENCFNAADVNGKQSVGGIAGVTVAAGKISNCYNTGSITASKLAGGIHSGTSATLCATAANCYNVGAVNSAASGGAINPGAATKADNSYYLNTSYVTGTSAKAGTAKTEAEMKDADFVITLGDAYAADAENINSGYPILKWQLRTLHIAAEAECAETNLCKQEDCVFAGDTVTVTVSVLGDAYVGAAAKFSYDPTLFELVSEVPADWEGFVTANGTATAKYYQVRTDGSSFDEGVIGTFTFKALKQTKEITGTFALDETYAEKRWENGASPVPATPVENTDAQITILEDPAITVTQEESAKAPVYGTAMEETEFFEVDTKNTDADDLVLEWWDPETESWTDKAPDGITAELADGEIMISTDGTADAGEYRFRVTNGEDDKSPAFVSAEGIFTVAPAPVTVTVDGKEKYVGESDPEFTGSVTAGTVYFDDDLGLTYARAADDEDKESAGDDITITATASNTNYQVTVVPAKLVIKAAEFVAELITDDYVKGYTLVLVYTDDGSAVSLYGDSAMVKLANSGYKYGETEYANVFGYVVKGAADAAKIAFRSGSANAVNCNTLDVNASESVDLRDAIAVAGVYNAKSVLMTEDNMALILRADVNRDKTVDTSDIILIKSQY